MRRVILTVSLALLYATGAEAAVPSSITIQGRLTDSLGNPLPAGVKGFLFRIFDSPSGGTQIWSGEDQFLPTDAQGLWAAQVGAVVGLNDAVFADTVRWLEIMVEGTILPRVRLVTGPYAHRVSTVDGSSGGTITSKVAIGPGHTNTGNHAFVAGIGNTASGNESTVGGGENNTASGRYAVVSGGIKNAATAPGAVVSGGGDSETFLKCFVGTDSNLATADFATVSGGTANRATDCLSSIAGGQANLAAGYGSSIGGGILNQTNDSCTHIAGGSNNRAHGRYSFVGGGGGRNPADSNSAFGPRSAIVGGVRNLTGDEGAFVGAGYHNIANGEYTVVVGGVDNSALDNRAAVVGGTNNEASGFAAFIGGGITNLASGIESAIPGGAGNEATGLCAFAAGRRANAHHAGTFVWSDTTSSDFTSTGVQQFLIRASGGVGIGINAPEAPLHVMESAVGGVAANASSIAVFERNAGGFVSILGVDGNPKGILFGDGSDAQRGGVIFDDAINNGLEFRVAGNLTQMVVDQDGDVGIRMTNPTNSLQVAQNTTDDPLADAWTIYSSRRWKENIVPIPDALSKVERLQGVEFDWKESGQHDVGLIAEDVGQVIPEVVAYEENGVDAKSVDYARLVAVLIEAVKTQQQRITLLEKKLEHIPQ